MIDPSINNDQTKPGRHDQAVEQLLRVDRWFRRLIRIAILHDLPPRRYGN
jgi:hypothetical protein